MKYILIALSIGAYIYVSNQDYQDQSSAEVHGAIQQTQDY